jgi:hypothetical protein
VIFSEIAETINSPKTTKFSAQALHFLTGPFPLLALVLKHLLQLGDLC